MPQLAWIVNKDRLNSRAHIAKYTGPLLISHGTADEVIPFSQGEALFAAANEPKGFLEIPGGTHNDWLNEEYLQTLQQFFDDLPPAK